MSNFLLPNKKHKVYLSIIIFIPNKGTNTSPNLKGLFTLAKLRDFQENTINNSIIVEESNEIFCGKLFELLQLAPFST
jgi:hypothetical protein